MIRNPTETLNDPNLRSEYRRRLADALRLAKGYQGTEAECQALVKTLADLERWLVGVFGQEEGLRFPESLEGEVAGNWQKAGRRKITDILRLGDERLSRHISDALGKNEISKSGLTMVNLEGVILPPEEGGIKSGNGEGGEVEDPRFQERLKELILALGEKDIRTDDIVLVRGEVYAEMMRKRSYAILEIPRIDREVLVCDQVGEATFVVYGIQGRKILMSEDKAELQARLGARVAKVVFRDPAQWKDEVINHLLKKVNMEALRKIDVRSQEGLRAEILKLIPTPETWAGMNRKEKSKFKVADMGLRAIATRFEIERNPVGNRKFHLELGRKVYGEGRKCLNELNEDELRMEILILCPTPEAWARMNTREKLAFKVAGIGLMAIARKFGAKGDPNDNHKFHLELGRKIFGEKHSCLNELSVDELKAEILGLVPTPEAWAGMNQNVKSAFKVAGMGLRAIAKKFGVEGGPISNHPVHLEVGRKVYGEGHKCLRFEKRPNLDITELIAEILELRSAPEAWAEMDTKEKSEFKVGGMGLLAIARKFGVKEDPNGNHKFHLELGKKVYGEGHKCLNELSEDELRMEILILCPTPEVWARMNNKERLAFKVEGMGLRAIAKKFGVEGGPIGNRPVHLEVGRKVYGEGHKCLNELSVGRLKAEIIGLIPTPETWAKMKVHEKSEFKVAGMGLMAIASKFGVKGNPVANHKFHLGLGRKIFGEGYECLRFEEKPDLDMEELKAEILKHIPNPEKWAEMKGYEKSEFKVVDIGLVAIATKFGVRGDPANNQKFHLELGRKIFGEKHSCLNELSVDELKAEILELVPTPEAWAGMKTNERKAFEVVGMGLIAIARRLGVKGNPIDRQSIHLGLGKAIFGEGNKCLRFEEKPNLSIEELKAEILELVPNPETWAGMRSDDKKAFKAAGIGLKAVATKFGTKGNPINNHKFHLELGEKIYGKK